MSEQHEACKGGQQKGCPETPVHIQLDTQLLSVATSLLSRTAEAGCKGTAVACTPAGMRLGNCLGPAHMPHWIPVRAKAVEDTGWHMAAVIRTPVLRAGHSLACSHS